MSNHPKTAILVLGMHRSGTSALTGVLNQFGVAIPLAPNTPIAADNPKGHWEHTQANRINDAILRASGQTWTTWATINAAEVPADQRKRLDSFLAHEIDRQSADVVAFKDPRICVLWPTWVEAIKALGHRPVAIFCVRHPLEVARSINKRNGLGRERGLLLWLHYNLGALGSLRELPHVVLGFPDWMQNPAELHQIVQDSLGVTLPYSWQQCAEDVARFISPDLVHQVGDEGDPDFLLQQSLQLYRLLSGAGPQLAETVWEQVEELRRNVAPWLDISARVVLDERRIWRDRINDMHALINRNL